MRQCRFIQLAFMKPEDEGQEDIGLFIVEFDNLILCLGKAVVESSFEVGGRIAKQLFVDMEAFDVCARADDDSGSGSSEGISARRQSVQSPVNTLRFCASSCGR
jgi:hypothetical protein